MGKKSMATMLLREFVEEERQCDRQTVPRSFIAALHNALETGMTCEGIVALLMLMTGFIDATRELPGDGVVERAVNLVRIMKGLDEEG